MCWLQENEQASSALHISHKPAFERRIVQRMVAREKCDATFVSLEAKERPKRLGEDSEPE